MTSCHIHHPEDIQWTHACILSNMFHRYLSLDVVDAHAMAFKLSGEVVQFCD